MVKFLRGITKKKLLMVGLASVLAAVLVLSGVTVSDRLSPQSDSSFHIGIGQKVITIGTEVNAAGTADYTTDGIQDYVQFNLAIAALPVGGGKLSILGGAYAWTDALTTVNVPANVTIDGVGMATSFIGDGATPIFTAIGNNSTFSNLRTDAGGISLGATTGWRESNVFLGATYYAYRTSEDITASSWDIPTGRTATYTVAASNAPAHVKAQADYVADGTADNVEIQAAIDATPASGGVVQLSGGIFYISSELAIVSRSSITLSGAGYHYDAGEGATRLIAVADNINIIRLSGNARTNVIEKMSIDGAARAGTVGIYVENGSFNSFRDLMIGSNGDWGVKLDQIHSNTFDRVHFNGNGSDSTEGGVLLGTSTTTAVNTIFTNSGFTSNQNGLKLVRTAGVSVRGSVFLGNLQRGIWYAGYTPTSSNNDNSIIESSQFEANGSGGAPYTNMRDIDISYGRFIVLINVRVQSTSVDYQIYTNTGTGTNNMVVIGGLATGTSLIQAISTIVYGAFEPYWKHEGASGGVMVSAYRTGTGNYVILKPNNVLVSLFGSVGWKPTILLPFLDGSGTVVNNVVDSWVDVYRNAELVNSPAWGTVTKTGWGKVTLTGTEYIKLPRSGISNDVAMNGSRTIIWVGVPNFNYNAGGSRVFFEWKYNASNRIGLTKEAAQGFEFGVTGAGTAKYISTNEIPYSAGDPIVAVMTVDATNAIMKLYVNGKLLGTNNGFGTVVSSYGSVTIGTYNTLSSFFLGDVSLFSVLPRLIEASEVREITRSLGDVVVGLGLTENSGTATVPNAATTIVVSHGLATTPTRVQITPRENPTNAVTFWWVDTLTATQFTINVNADPGVSNLDFDWRAVIGEGN